MKLIEFDNYEIRVADEALLIKPIRKLFNQDKTSTKEKFFQQMSYMYFMINPARYAVKKYKEGSLKDGVVKENPIIEYRFPIITLESGDHLLIDTMDIDFVIEDFIEESLNEKAAKAGIYTPNNTIIS